MKKIISILSCIVVLTVTASAHSGSTDKNGGHYDHAAEEYHYHHGFAAHQHPDGICPFETDDSQNQSNAGTIPYELDDGTFETAFNLGYEFGQECLYDLNGDEIVGLDRILIKLYDQNHWTTSTLLIDVNYTFEEAYKEGYYQSEIDLERYIEENSVDAYYDDETDTYTTENPVKQSESTDPIPDGSEPTTSEKKEARQQIAASDHPIAYLIIVLLCLIGAILTKRK